MKDPDFANALTELLKLRAKNAQLREALETIYDGACEGDCTAKCRGVAGAALASESEGDGTKEGA